MGKKIKNTFLNKFNYQSAESKTESESQDINVEKIDFFGLDVKPVPLFTYSLLQLIGYGIMYYIKISDFILSPIIRGLFRLRNILFNSRITP